MAVEEVEQEGPLDLTVPWNSRQPDTKEVKELKRHHHMALMLNDMKDLDWNAGEWCTKCWEAHLRPDEVCHCGHCNDDCATCVVTENVNIEVNK